MIGPFEKRAPEFYVPFAQTVDPSNQLAHINGKQPEYDNLSHNLTNLVSVTSSPLFSIACIYG